MSNTINKVRQVKFDNGITIRGSYHYQHGGIVTDLRVSDWHGRALHVRSAACRDINANAFEVLAAAIDQMRQELLACNISQFVGDEGMKAVKKILVGIEKIRRSKVTA